MRITPLDIQQKQFSSKFKGFDTEEVYSFLTLIKEEVEDLTRINAELREEAGRIGKQLMEYKAMEATIKETITSSLQMAEGIKSRAKRQAELMLEQAESKAQEIIKEAKEAQERLVKIQKDIDELKYIRRHFKEELKQLAADQLTKLD